MSNFINFKLICKTELLDVIYNYFSVCQNKIIDEEINFIFNTKDMRNFFNLDLLSREDLYNFVFSLTEKEIKYFDDVSFKGNNKISKSCPEINRSSNPKRRNIKS